MTPMIILIVALVVALAVGCVCVFVVRLIYIRYIKKKIEMETEKKKIMQSSAFKAITIVFLILILLIPSTMIQNLIGERQERSRATVLKINDKWSRSQTLCAPLLLLPYTTTKIDKDQKPYYEDHTLYITPQNLTIDATLVPEERHYGIYKSILYRSDIHFGGNFSELSNLKIDNSEFHFDKAQIAIGVTDLRGVSQNPDFRIGDQTLGMTVGVVTLFSVSENTVIEDPDKFGSRSFYSGNQSISGKTLIVNLKDIHPADSLTFECTMQLNGSGAISFIPIGQHTTVTVSGQWPSPSFIGSFSPESSVDNKAFNAS